MSSPRLPSTPRLHHTGQRLVFAYRRALVVVAHLLLWSTAFFGAYLLRFDFRLTEQATDLIGPSLVLLLLARTLVTAALNGFRGMWRYTGSRDLLSLVKSTTLSSCLFVVLLAALGIRTFPRSIVVIDWLGAIILVGGLRFGSRLLRELAMQTAPDIETQVRILIAGAGNTGEALLREIQRTYASRFQVVGFVDDDPAKLNATIHGVQVLGPIEGAASLTAGLDVKQVIVAMPKAPGERLRRLIADCKPLGVAVRTVPGLDHLMDARVSVQHIRDVAIEDLLGREPVELDASGVFAFLRGQRVLVTGAGGSIGSELCRQIARFSPERLILVEQAENALFTVEQQLRLMHDLTWSSHIADVYDVARLQQIFAVERPTVVLHAAAHKHVPIMEDNPGEAIKNNVMGTKHVADMACAFRAERFILISTDKAVNPISVMGATKRLAELYVQARGRESETQFITVRFGNVLGSNGSVIPIFKEQIARGGPVTVTDPQMTRYFMTIPEACQLVLQAGAMGEGGELFMLDMGEPVRIVDLARDLIILSGLIPGQDIEIHYSGIRKGEKLYEELCLSGDNIDRTRHPKIFIGRTAPRALREMNWMLSDLEAKAVAGLANEHLREALMALAREDGERWPEAPAAPAQVVALRA
ncbi:MAG TPA: nucleoside-diphosphate sugar epimerase/dehydratase [Myxococcota bacterium]|nr:nucleoside-diphosphate sugar epimerase/dehydratase [Myxococcota bacterium]